MKLFSTHTLTALLSCGALVTPVLAQSEAEDAAIKEQEVAPPANDSGIRSQFGQNNEAKQETTDKETKDAENDRKGDAVRAGDSDNVDPIKGDDMTVVAMAAGNSEFSTLVAALKAAGLTEALSGVGPFTIFAPNNDAFEKIPQDTLDDLMKPENKERLSAILQAHVVKGKIMADVLRNMEGNTANDTETETVIPAAVDGDIAVTEKDAEADQPGTINENKESTKEEKNADGDNQINRISMAGSTLEFTFDGDDIMVDGAKIIKSDLVGTNGVIHVIDAVLIPVQPE